MEPSLGELRGDEAASRRPGLGPEAVGTDVERAVAEVRSSALRAVVDTNVWVSLIAPERRPHG